jgi:integrase
MQSKHETQRERHSREKTMLTVKYCNSLTDPGHYLDYGGPVKGLYLIVQPTGSKSWTLSYRSPLYRTRKNRREMGLGPYPEVSLAKAREKAEEARKLIRDGNDPIEDRKEQEHKRWRDHAKAATFKELADSMVDAKLKATKPWKPGTLKTALLNIKYLKPLHNYPPAEITPKHVFDVIQPWRDKGKHATAHQVLIRANTIFAWAAANEAFPADKKFPTDMEGPLSTLLQTDDIEPEHKARGRINWRNLPALMTKLAAFKPRKYYTVGEAARACGVPNSRIYNAIAKGKLKTTKPEFPVFAGSWQEHMIDPEVLFNSKLFPKFADVIPGLPPISVYFLQFMTLNGLRFDEVRYLRWREWQRDGQLLVIPWQRMKARNKHGAKEIRIDHVIPLTQPSIDILTMLDEQRERDRNESEFAFGNYRTTNNTSGRIGQPICGQTVRNLLARLVSLEDVEATLHGMRTAFRSWAGAQRRFLETDMERSIAHVKGHGETPLVRLYSRDDDDIAPLVPIFEGWAEFCLGRSLPAGVIPIRKQVKQA